MTDWAPFVVSGLVIGSVYAIAAMGLVVTYRTTGLFNFAHGAVGMSSAYAFFQLRERWHLPTPLALALTLLVFAPALGIGIDRLLFRHLDEAAQATKIVVTMALLILLQGVAVALYGATQEPVAPFLPTKTFVFADVAIGYDQMSIVGLALIILTALAWFFRYTRLGLVMRAAVDDRRLVQAAGFSTGVVAALTWSLGSALAGLAGILFSPLLGLDSAILTLLVVQAYAAAVFGRLTNLPMTVIGAFGLGLTSSLSLNVFKGAPNFLNGFRQSLPFVFLFAVLVLSRHGRLRELGISAPWSGVARGGAADWKRIAIILVPLALVLSDSRVFVLGNALVIACGLLSIVVLSATSGLISLTQAGLVGTGAFVYIHLVNARVPFLLALLLAGLSVIPLGLAIAIPALRLPGLFLALATFGLGQLLDGLVFSSWHWLSGGSDGLRGTRPALLRTDRAYVFFVIAVLLVLVAAIKWLRRSSLGRTLVALRDSPSAAEALGINPLWPRVAIFTVSAFVAGMAGGLYAGLLESASKTYFNTFTSLLWLTIAVVGGIHSAYGAVVGALAFYFVPDMLSTGRPSAWLAPLFGLAAIVLARRTGGIVALVGDWWPRRLVVIRQTNDPQPTEPANA